MSNIKLFESKKIRSSWNQDEEKWYFSIIDVVGILTDQPTFQGARNYWKVLKNRLVKEGNETVTNCNRLKLVAEDGKLRETDVADTQQLFRLIQSIPSPKAEPFKQWLAKTGYERIEETQDPEKSIDRAMENYLNLGYSKEWINQRLKSIEVRKELTDEWENRGVKKGQEFATLTEKYPGPFPFSLWEKVAEGRMRPQAWSGKTVNQYKRHKNLKKENLRDNMTNLELVLSMLAEATTTEISKEKNPKNFDENKIIAKQGGTIAGNTRKAIEARSGKKIVSPQNANKLKPGKGRKKIE